LYARAALDDRFRAHARPLPRLIFVRFFASLLLCFFVSLFCFFVSLFVCLLFSRAPPPPRLMSVLFVFGFQARAKLVRMGFPRRRADAAAPSLAFAGGARRVEWSRDGYVCPRCRARATEAFERTT